MKMIIESGSSRFSAPRTVGKIYRLGSDVFQMKMTNHLTTFEIGIGWVLVCVQKNPKQSAHTTTTNRREEFGEEGWEAILNKVNNSIVKTHSNTTIVCLSDAFPEGNTTV